ncbi:MAG: acyl-ACP--UDP-N-acetylglucosamine O-acyltransferase [Desulfobulbaceae bacterium]|nr:acyl-ACP--UDP-N-acetylglucosamine O-acyltransferase [Desulfobulbaceae bacterium]
MNIHPTAVVDPGAEIHQSAIIGAYAVIEKDVVIGADTVVDPHAVIYQYTTIGERNKIGSFSSIGAPPQDLSYKGEATYTIIGDDNQIREYVSIHRGTPSGSGKTVIGNHNLLMGYTHIAHDCILDNHVIMANVATLGGHVHLADYVNLGGVAAIHQFCRIGSHCYVGGLSGITKDVPPFVILAGTRNNMRVSGINKIGLLRHGISKDTIAKLESAFRLIFRSDLLLKDALDQVSQEFSDCAEVEYLVDFFRTSKRGVVKRIDDEE